jgi:hypothetical protein
MFLHDASEVIYFKCRNPTLAKCGGEAQHLEKVSVATLLWPSVGVKPNTWKK